jgi:uncharacterized membrane protein
MSRRIRLQIVITVISSMLVLGLMAYVAVTRAAVSRPIEGGALSKASRASLRRSTHW